jgi:hypothetical protein
MILAAAHHVFAATTIPGDSTARFLPNSDDQNLGDYLALYIFFAFRVTLPKRILDFAGSPPEWATTGEMMALTLQDGTITVDEPENSLHLGFELGLNTLKFKKVLLLPPDHVAAPRVIFLIKTNAERYAWVVIRVQEDRKAPAAPKRLKGTQQKPKKRPRFEPVCPLDSMVL